MERLEYLRRELKELSRKAAEAAGDSMYTEKAREKFLAVKESIDEAVANTYAPVGEEVPY